MGRDLGRRNHDPLRRGEVERRIPSVLTVELTTEPFGRQEVQARRIFLLEKEYVRSVPGTVVVGVILIGLIGVVVVGVAIASSGGYGIGG